VGLKSIVSSNPVATLRSYAATPGKSNVTDYVAVKNASRHNDLHAHRSSKAARTPTIAAFLET